MMGRTNDNWSPTDGPPLSLILILLGFCLIFMSLS